MNEITQFLVNHGGPVLFAVVFVEQAGLPLPSAPWLLAAGALAAGGSMNPVVAVLMAAAASVAADLIWFYIGRRGGQRVLRFFCRLSLAQNSCVGRSRGVFSRYGMQGLLAAKFLPGLGAVMPPLAGAMGLSTRRFVIFDGMGSLFYGGFYVAAGFLFHNQLRRLAGVLNDLGLSALLLFLLAAGYVVFKYLRRRTARARTQPAIRLEAADLAERTAADDSPLAAAFEPPPAEVLSPGPPVAEGTVELVQPAPLRV